MNTRCQQPRYIALALLAAIILALSAGCSDWKYDVTHQGIAFSKFKTEPNGLAIGLLNADTIVGHRPCKQGWLHLHPNGVPAAFTAAAGIDLGKFKIPADTWVLQNADGMVMVCAFPQDTKVQGHWCRGTGGPKGVQAAFYPDGALKQYYPVRETEIDHVPCGTGLVSGWIELHENGRLKSGVLSRDLVREGRNLSKGTRLNLDPAGRILP